jgi:hypothetical protein
MDNQIDIDYDIPQKTNNNIYNDYPLPDMIAKDNGTVNYCFRTSSTANLTLDTIKVNPTLAAYPGGFINCFITINAVTNGWAALYEWNAYAGNNGLEENPTVIAGIDKNARELSPDNMGDPQSTPPIAAWVDVGNYKILRFTFTRQWTGYYINIKIAGWRLHVRGA